MIVVAAAACAVDLEGAPSVETIRRQLVAIGHALGMGDGLAEVWDDL